MGLGSFGSDLVHFQVALGVGGGHRSRNRLLELAFFLGLTRKPPTHGVVIEHVGDGRGRCGSS